MRNHLPRTSVGTVLVWLVSLFWYGIFAAAGVVFAVVIPELAVSDLREWLSVGFLVVFLFWQVIPLVTLSTGWSLQLDKLRIYPVSNGTLFGIEILLRLSTAPEMILVLTGALIGLERRPDTPLLSAAFVLFYIPLNLFLSLTIREFVLHSFKRNRFRELFAIVLISISVLPQLLLRTELGHRAQPFFLAIARSPVTPWREVANLCSARFSLLDLGLLGLWIVLFYFLAQWQFRRTLLQDEAFRAASSVSDVPKNKEWKLSPIQKLLDIPGQLFSDPLAVLLQKEFQSLVRMPRFRVMFGMACFFSVIIFFSLSFRGSGGIGFIGDNFLPMVTLYGLLLLSDVLLLNVFGFDRQAAQIYFVTPVPFRTVLKAKNLTAISFIVLQNIVVLLIAGLMRLGMTLLNAINAIAASAVIGIFFLSVGNLTSVIMPRAIDPTQTFRKQAGGKMQLWFALCSLGVFVLMAFAFLARWALRSNWALLAVLLLEFLIGLILYRLSTESAVERALRDKEQILESLSKGSAPVGLGM